MENKKINSIINVTVNGMNTSDCVKSVKSRLESVERSVFNIALISGYACGTTIPCYVDNKGEEHGEATIEKPMKQADYLKLVGRSKSTLSRWIKAMNLIIENGYFSDFANGKYPFSYDKIILIFDEKTKEFFNGYVIADLMNLSVDSLESLVAKHSEEEETSETSEEETTSEEVVEEEAEEETSEEVETITLSYNGKEYTVSKVAFEKWLSENAITE